jgi:diguanylate cyclase (GGDEF)-like protein/hemerythrin-like metal-binding protein
VTLHPDQDGNLGTIVGVTRDVTERKHEEDAIRRLAYHDGLTGLPNRRLLLDRLEQTLARARRDRSHLALLFIDLDRFKPINDELGHEVGDWILCSVAKRMKDCLRAYDTAARVGGDEFVVLLSDLDCIEDAAAVAERVRVALARPFVMEDGLSLGISCSIGLAGFPDHADNERDLLRVGDEAMYRAKNAGRGRVEMPLADEPSGRLWPETPPISADTALMLDWKPAHACGEPDIDREHRELFRTANRLLTNLTRRAADPSHVERTFGQLVSQLVAHFGHEEGILHGRGYAGLDAHSSLHRTLIAQAMHLNERIGRREARVGELIQFVVVEVVAKHLVGADRAFFSIFRHEGGPEARERQVVTAA